MRRVRTVRGLRIPLVLALLVVALFAAAERPPATATTGHGPDAVTALAVHAVAHALPAPPRPLDRAPVTTAAAVILLVAVGLWNVRRAPRRRPSARLGQLLGGRAPPVPAASSTS